MKNLLLITALFITVSCLGQGPYMLGLTYSETTGLVSYSDTIEISSITVNDVISSENPAYLAFYEHMAFEWWLKQQYLEYCYADSISITYDWYVIDGDTLLSVPSMDPGFGFGYVETKAIYEHQQPTFEGYAKWLEKFLTSSQ